MTSRAPADRRPDCPPFEIPVPEHPAPPAVLVRGARVHTLRDVSVDIPLGRVVGVAGVSGSGKSSLALGVLYAEGSRRYLESLSTYTRRRMTQAPRADVDRVLYAPAALALRQRPGAPGVRSTFGTGTELLNGLRLMFSRLAHHRCPNGHMVPPSIDVAAERPLTCPECGEKFFAPSAEDLSFNGAGACPTCDGTGIVHTVDPATLVPDESLTIEQGAVAPWQTLMWSLMKDMARDMGVRTDVPFSQLSDAEREIVFHGPAEKRHILYQNKGSGQATELDFTYFNAVRTVENALVKVKDEKGMARVARFLRQGPCPDCGGTRLSDAARALQVADMGLDQACELTLSGLVEWVACVPKGLPTQMRPLARDICDAVTSVAQRLLDLGLGYLTLDRATATLSTGERQRMQLARSVRNRTTGVLYVLDEPSIGLHPANLEGLLGVVRDLVEDGNSVVMVDHDVEVLRRADWLVEMGPGAGAAGGCVIAQGTPEQVAGDPESVIGGFLAGRKSAVAPGAVPEPQMFSLGRIALDTDAVHTVRPLHVEVPRGRLVVVTGVSGSGKTTLVLESLVPALRAGIAGEPLPAHVRGLDVAGIAQVRLIDATPVGVNVRSTVATYANVHDELRKAFARTPQARELGLKAGDFSYNIGSLRCPTCDGTGSISLDVQFLPDVEITCPQCRGSRYSKRAGLVRRAPKPSRRAAASDEAGHGAEGQGVGHTLPELMEMSVDEALVACADLPVVARRLQALHDLGLGYLTLGEQTPALSGGEAQRLKLASDMGRSQADALFVFDEPTIGLHPLDVSTLLGVFRRLVDSGATVVVIEHDLDVIRSADWVIDMGPGGGDLGGRIVATGTPEQVRDCEESVTGRYI